MVTVQVEVDGGGGVVAVQLVRAELLAPKAARGGEGALAGLLVNEDQGGLGLGEGPADEASDIQPLLAEVSILKLPARSSLVVQMKPTGTPRRATATRAVAAGPPPSNFISDK